MRVEADTSTVAPGDTVRITPKLQFDNGKVADFPSYQLFSPEVDSGRHNGTLLEDIEEARSRIPGPFYQPGSDTADAWTNLPIGFGFIADSLAPLTSSSRVYVSTYAFGEPLIPTRTPQGPLPQLGSASGVPAAQSSPVTAQSALPRDGILIEGTGTIVIDEEEPETIMLGETSYYYATEDPDDPDKLLIKATGTKYNKEPAAPEAAIADVFGDEPIEVVSGGKSGVYWEKKWPEIASTGTVTMHTLSDKLIRLVGRYWEAGTTYKVKLKASSGDKTGELEIEVVKPESLGDKFNKAKDALDNKVNMDSLIVKYAGKFGIPPQIVKAHISVESETKDFGGDIKTGFAPSYRYEPYTTQYDEYLEYWSDQYYINDLSSNEFSDVPSHFHVKTRNYFKEPNTVWDVIRKNSQLVNPNGSKLYGKRDSNGKMNFYPKSYRSIQRKYDLIYISYALFGDMILESAIADSANKTMITYLRDFWEGGTQNEVAQTRTASSYGYLQMLYTTAKEQVNYSKNEVPENMNLVIFFDQTLQYQKDLLQDHLGEEVEKSFNWPDGFENAIRESIFTLWNPGGIGYPNMITNKINQFLPNE